ncbi:type I-E CRISPR-associated endoribonuclease Cas2e [Buchananella felis]|uniref:type I-E CRISPR-associated endoribonuclease Cas2e n=2 Tax=Buchananella felis TaxID=3231492 RepID=UPI0035278C71
MVVLLLSAAPAGLRGAMTRWMMELAAGVFVGNLSARVREQVWELVAQNLGQGRALLLWSSRCEQGFEVASLGHERVPTNLDGFLVLLEPYKTETSPNRLTGSAPARQEGWSVAGRRRKFRNSTERALGNQ